MKIIYTDEMSVEVKHELLGLWNTEYPALLSYSRKGEFEGYLNSLEKLKHV